MHSIRLWIGRMKQKHRRTTFHLDALNLASKMNTLFIAFVQVMLFSCLAITTYAAHPAPAKALTLSELKSLVGKLPTNEIPIEANEEVLHALNYVITNPGIAKSYAVGIKRLSKWNHLNDILKAQNVPVDLMAILLVESRGENIYGKGSQKFLTAGLWQIIPSTARKYGLIVKGKQDDRLNPTKSTHAIAHYFRGLYQQTGSWPLAIMGYNMGGERVMTLQKRNHSNDPWVLLRASHLPAVNKRYLATIEAAVILMHYPELLDPVQ
jgi:hypothetical protein